MENAIAANQSVAIAVLRIRVRAEVHADSKLPRVSNDRHQLVEIVVSDDCVEPDAVDSLLTHAGDHVEDLFREARGAACAIMPLVEKIEREVELVDAGLPE